MALHYSYSPYFGRVYLNPPRPPKYGDAEDERRYAEEMSEFSEAKAKLNTDIGVMAREQQHELAAQNRALLCGFGLGFSVAALGFALLWAAQ